MKRLRAAIVRSWSRFVARSGRWQRVALLAAMLVVCRNYACNDDMNGDFKTPRGDGVYRPVLARGDGHMMYLMARSTALDGDWAFNNDLSRFGDPWNQPLGPTGRKEIPHPIGPPLVWTPLIWIAEGAAAIADVFGADIPLHGYTDFHQRIVFFSSILFACGAVLLGRRVAHKAIGGSWSPTYAAIAVLLGTSLTYYATYMPSYGHAMDAGFSALFLGSWALTIGDHTRRRYVVLGLVLGVSALIRVQNFALGLTVAIEIAVAVISTLRRREEGWSRDALRLVGLGSLALGAAVLAFTPQLFYWHQVYGDWFAMPQGALYTRFGSPMILQLLYAPRNGWFSTTPIAYLAIIGLALVPRRARLIGFGLAATVAVQVYLNSTILDWWGMNSFGARRLCSMTLPLVVGLASLLWRFGQRGSRLRRAPALVWHAVALAILGPLVAWNIWRIGDYKHGKAPPADLIPTCCGHTPELVRAPLQRIYEAIGNPFEFPANAWFAVEHGVEIQRWDRAEGNYPLMPPAASLVDGTLWKQRGSWKLGDRGSEPYLIGAWSKSFTGDRPFRWTLEASARAIVPNLMPYGQSVTVWLAPGADPAVTVKWDGAVVAQPTLVEGWNGIRFEVHDMFAGDHELELDASLQPVPSTTQWPTPARPVGVAVGRVELEFLPRSGTLAP